MPDQTALQTSALPSKITLSAETVVHEIKAFLAWWYVEMPTWYIGFIQRVLLLCDDTFSISLLIKTFFVPWHRDYSMIGHGFGIVLRLIYLPMVLVLTGVIIAVLIVITLFWALLPIISMLYLLKTPFT